MWLHPGLYRSADVALFFRQGLLGCHLLPAPVKPEAKGEPGGLCLTGIAFLWVALGGQGLLWGYAEHERDLGSAQESESLRKGGLESNGALSTRRKESPV